MRRSVRRATKTVQRSSNPPMPGPARRQARLRGTPEAIRNEEKGVHQTRESGFDPDSVRRDVGNESRRRKGAAKGSGQRERPKGAAKGREEGPNIQKARAREGQAGQRPREERRGGGSLDDRK